jgi:hypothetical protein
MTCLKYSIFLFKASIAINRYLHFRRIDLQPDPVARGSQFDNLFLVVRFTISPMMPRFIYAKERMQLDSTYRPGTLIINGSRRGVKRAPEKYGSGEWEICKHDGDHVR